jgi:hypothetical protein
MPSVFLRQRTRIPSSLPNSVTARITYNLCVSDIFFIWHLFYTTTRTTKIPTPSHGAMATTDDSSVAYATPVFSPSKSLAIRYTHLYIPYKPCSTQLNPPTNSYNSFQLIGITQTGLNELFTGNTHLL